MAKTAELSKTVEDLSAPAEIVESLGVEEILQIREKLVDALAALDTFCVKLEIYNASPDKSRPRRQLGRLAGQGDLTLEQALAPMDEEELKAWGL